MDERSYKKYFFLKAAALALALAIGANGAIFSLEALNRAGEIYPDPIRLLFESDLQSQADDSPASDEVKSNPANALLLGCYHVALNSCPVSASIMQAIAGKGR